MTRVFISSTSLDLKPYRQVAREVCTALEFEPVMMEDFEAMGVGATEGSKRKLNKADLYVGVVAHRYGYVENGYSNSVTEIEFDYAGERNLERLCFLVDPTYTDWHAVAQTYHPELVAVEFGDTAFHKVLILRGVVRRIVMSILQENVPSKADMDTLNRFFARERLQIEAVGPRLFQQYYTGDKSGLITLATAAAHLLVQTDLSRLHQCKNERCILLFYDTTKNGARRWCTPDCQNRARSIEHYHKRREGD